MNIPSSKGMIGWTKESPGTATIWKGNQFIVSTTQD